MVLRLLSLALLLGATSIAAQVPARAPTRAATAASDTTVGWFGFRQLLVGDTLTVLEIAAGSPAQRAGLRAGDWIMAIDGHSVNERSLNAWPAAVGDVRKVTVRRGNETFTLSMVAEAPPSRVLMPTRAATASRDTIASEARELRGQMALRATRAATLRPTITVDSAGNEIASITATGRRALRDTLTTSNRSQDYRELRATWDSSRGELRTRTPMALSDTAVGATVARLTRAPNAISGAEFEELNPGLAEYFYGVSEGVFVLRIAENSPASSGGLRPGDIIQSVNGQDIRTVAELRAAIAASGRTANLRILRKGVSSGIIFTNFGSATRRSPPPEGER